MSAARVIRMTMRHQRARDRLRGVDPRIRHGNVDAARMRFDPAAQCHGDYMVLALCGSNWIETAPGFVEERN
jgi:hypothetical protein